MILANKSFSASAHYAPPFQTNHAPIKSAVEPIARSKLSKKIITTV
jgi:hypothetical protein